MRLRTVQEMLTMLGMGFRQAVEMQLRETGRDRRWLCEQTGISESVLSRLLAGHIKPSLPHLLSIETALGLRRGHFLRQAGFVDDGDVTLEQMISYDNRFNVDQRSALLQVVRDFTAANFSLEPGEVRHIETAPTRRAARKAPKPGA